LSIAVRVYYRRGTIDRFPWSLLASFRESMTDHVQDERLAEYSKGLMVEPELGEVEEHLLVCDRCRDRLTEFDNEWGLNG